MTHFGKEIDDDYIDVETRRADVSTVEDADDNIQRDLTSAGQRNTADVSFDMSFIFDDGDGSGSASSLDELIDENAVIENDGRSDTRTFYYPSEADARHEARFARMLRWQDGEGDPQRAVENRAADRRRYVDTFCSRLEMNDYQQERVLHIVEGLNMSHMAHYSSQHVILAIISLVANEDGRFIRDEDGFRELIRDVGTDLSDIKSIRDLVRRKSDRL